VRQMALHIALPDQPPRHVCEFACRRIMHVPQNCINCRLSSCQCSCHLAMASLDVLLAFSYTRLFAERHPCQPATAREPRFIDLRTSYLTICASYHAHNANGPVTTENPTTKSFNPHVSRTAAACRIRRRLNEIVESGSQKPRRR